VPDWGQFLRDHDEALDTIRRHVRTGRPWGTAEWVRDWEQRLQRPLLPRRGGWPKGRLRKIHAHVHAME
jgi:hypothetical protein